MRGCQNIILKTEHDEQHASLIGQDPVQGVAVLAAEAGGRGAPGLPLAENSPQSEKLVQVGYQLRGADAAAQAVVGGLDWKTSPPALTLGTAPNPPLAGGPLLDGSGRVIAFQVNGDAGSHLVMAPALGQLLKNNPGAPKTIAASSGDLSGIGAEAKKSLVLVECKP